MRKKDPNTTELREIQISLSTNEDITLPKVHPPKKQDESPKENGDDIFEMFAPFQNVYNFAEVVDKVNDALRALNLICENTSLVKSWRYSPERKKDQDAYIAKLGNFIMVSNEYIKLLGKIDRKFIKVFDKANLDSISLSLDTFIDLFESSGLKSAPRFIKGFHSYKEFLTRLSKDNSNLESFQDDEVFNLTTEMSIAFSTVFFTLNKPELLAITQGLVSQIPKLSLKTSKIYELLTIKKRMSSGMHSAIHDIENVLIEARLLLLIQPDQGFINGYLKINIDLINVQIGLLELFSKTSDPVMRVWPYLNRDLLRAQEKGKPVQVDIILYKKRQDLLVYQSLSAVELVPLIDVINKTEKVKDILQKDEANLEDHLRIMTDICATDAFRQNPLVKAVALSIVILCYGVKNRLSVKQGADKKAVLQSDIIVKIQYIKDFVDNLDQLKLAWNSDLFKFLNSFIFFKSYVQSVVAYAELVFLNCEFIFKHAEKDLELRNHIIKMQIGLLEMQNTLLHFSKDLYQEQYVKCFYFKDENRNEIVAYSTVEKNRIFAETGNLHKEIYGIPIEDILKLNAARKLKLEAIPLEYLAKQRLPKESDYDQAISGKELEEYLKKWDKEAAAEKALEEKQHKAPKQHKLRRQAAKDTKAAQKRKQEGKGDKPDNVETTKLVVRPAHDPLAKKMGELLLLLNPRDFKPADVTRAIKELHPFTLNSQNNEEQVFKALSAIGDSYSMIAGHNLNRKKKNPKDLLVNLELALNYYSRAELELRKLTDISFEEHSHYYTWLQHSVAIQRQLLDEYVHKFTFQCAQLLASKEKKKQEMGEEWYKRHLMPGWKESAKTLQTKALQEVLNAVKAKPENRRNADNAAHAVRTQPSDQTENVYQTMVALQETCRELESRMQEKVKLSENSHMVYSFEHLLARAKKRALPEQQCNYKFVTPTTEVVEMTASEPDDQGVVDLLPIVEQSQANSQITFSPIVNLNPYGTMHMDRPLVPVFNFPYLVLPSAFRQNQLPSENDFLYSAEDWLPQSSQEGAVMAYQPQYAPPRVFFPGQPQDPYQPQYSYPIQSYIPPFTNVPASYYNYVATGYFDQQPQQPQMQIVYELPQTTYGRRQNQVFALSQCDIHCL